MRRLLLMSLFLLGSVACGSDGGGHAGHAEGGAAPGSEGSVPGTSADDSEADRRIEVTALDELRFDPGSIEAAPGEVVTFVVTNEGQTDHEFVLGDQAYQESHGDDMQHDMSMGNAVSVGPGETEELTWEFSEEGEVLYGCHEPGHFDGGMVGSIQVK